MRRKPLLPPAVGTAAAASAASSILLLPALLPPRIQAGDLSSHLYNTWLVLRVKAGEPLGLDIVPQYSNVLFDWWLEGLWRLGGPALAERASVCLAVLLFFWGAFAMISRLGGSSAWASVPMLAMTAYGWLFSQGFFNYYLSCAFGFWSVYFASGRGWLRLAAAPALGLAAVSHLLGAATGAGLVLYFLLRGSAGRRWRVPQLCIAVALLCVAAILAGLWMKGAWDLWRFSHLLGISPFLLAPKYIAAAAPLLACWAAAAAQARRPGGIPPAAASACRTADALTLTAAAVLLMPASLQWPGTSYPLHFIGWRLAPWFTLFLHAMLCRFLPPARIALFTSAAAILYFAFLGQDIRRLNRLEDAFHQTVRQAPMGSRVISLLTSRPEGRNPVNHMIDRACIGRCFSYANYEPATGQFRLRARPGSPANLSSVADLSALQAGRYVIRRRDLPLYAVVRSPGPGLALELRPLSEGDRPKREILLIDEAGL